MILIHDFKKLTVSKSYELVISFGRIKKKKNRVMFRDSCEEKKSLRELADQFKVRVDKTTTFNGLAEKYAFGGKQCTRPTANIYHQTPEDCVHEKKIKEFERLLDGLIKKLELKDKVNDLLVEGKRKKKLAVVPKKMDFPTKYLDKCESNYDWTYVNYYANDDISSPSGVSLKSVSSYYVLPSYPNRDGMAKFSEEKEVLPCEPDFLHIPRNQKGKFIEKTLPPHKKLKLKKEIASLLQGYEEFKKKRKFGCSTVMTPVNIKDMILMDKINMGFIPDLEDRADLISLYKKIRPKVEDKKKKEDAYLREEACSERVLPPKLKYFRPNNERQMAVLTRYTPKDHANIDVMDRQRRGQRKLARINKMYYGNGPTFWKSKHLDDIWYTDDVINRYKCTEEPCICPKKSEDEINKKKRELSHPTFLSLTVNEKELLKHSWKNRGINKSTLAMMWFTKLFKANPEELLKHNHGQILEELFMDQTNLDYMDKLAEIFSIVVQNIDKSTLCTKLIWELGMYHRCLDLNESYFELLKKTLLDTLIENFHPLLTPEQIAVWKKFIGIMFDIIYDIFLWNGWPLDERTSLRKRQELEKDLPTSFITISSDDLLLPLSKRKEKCKEVEVELEEQSDTVEEQEQEAESSDQILEVLYTENVSVDS